MVWAQAAATPNMAGIYLDLYTTPNMTSTTRTRAGSRKLGPLKANLSAHSTQLEAGCVELIVRTDQDVSIDVAGVTSCTSDGQCGPGESCGADLQCSGP